MANNNSKFEQMLNDPEFQSLPESDQNQLIDEFRQRDFGKIPNTENILQRAARGLMEPGIKSVAQVTGGIMNKNPFQALTGLGSAQSAGYQGLMNVKDQILEPSKQANKALMGPVVGGVMNFGTDMATDPLTYAGLGAGKSMIEEGGNIAKKTFPYISKEARVGFTKGVENSLINRRAALTRAYGSALNKSKATVDLSHVVDEGSEITKFSMKEAQDLKNAITQGIPEAVKSGVKVNPKHFFDRKIAGMITDAMKKADPEIAPVIEKFGEHAENFKSAIAPIKSAKGTENIFGSNLIKQMFGAGGSIPEKADIAMKEFAPRLSKEVHGAKVNENIFRALRGIAIGGVASKFVPSFLKRALLSEATK